jgi:inorganic pyrophosphatase
VHPWHDIPLPEARPLSEFPVVIEIPRGEKNKYELDPATGILKLDRVLASSVHYPHNYGFIPRTLAEDGDALDVLVLGQQPVVPLTMLQARAIGGFRMRDEEGVDDKIVCVHVDDPAFAGYREMAELPEHLVVETMDFFERYKTLENKDADVGERLDRKEALLVVDRCAARYREQMA